MANATRAEENYEELAQDEQQVNDTVTEDTKEFNVISRAFQGVTQGLVVKNKTDSKKAVCSCV